MTISRGFEALGELLEGFVEREIDGALVLACDDVQVAYAAKLLAGLDERDPADVVQVFVAGVGEAVDGYVDRLVVTLEEQLAVIDGRLDAAGQARWPRLPAEARAGEPCARVLALLAWARARVPAGDHRLVWALLPVEIGDREGWGRLGAGLLAAERPAGVRLVLRDDAAAPGFVAVAEDWPDARVLAYRVELDTARIVEGMAAVAGDPGQAPRERMMAMLQLTYLDLGFGRLDEARRKFSAIAEFFGKTGEPTLQALALGGAAEAVGRAGDAAGARAGLEEALVLAVRAGAWPVALNHAITLGALCRDGGLVAAGEAYYRLAAVTAGRLGNRRGQADALEQVGALRAAQGDREGALRAWGEAVSVCCDATYLERLGAVLERMMPVYRQAGREAEARACAGTLAKLQGEVAA